MLVPILFTYFFVSIPGCWFKIPSRGCIMENSIFSYLCIWGHKKLIFIIICLISSFFFLSSFLDFSSFIYCPLFLLLCSFLNSYHLLLNYILLYTQNTFVHLFFWSFTAQKYPMVHLLQKGDNSFNQELLKNMVKSIKMNDVYGPMSQILDTLSKCPHFKRQR